MSLRPKSRPVRAAERVSDFLTREIWSMELGGLPTFRALFYRVSRIAFLAGRGFVKDRSLIRASALTYMTVLSLVPLLAFAFSVAKGLGAYDTLLNQTVLPFLDETFGIAVDAAAGGPGEQEAPVAALELRHAIDTVLGFVQQTNFASLGTFGLLILLYTVVKLLSSVEQALNDIWGVHKQRTIVRKVADYLSILVIVPILMIAGASVSASVADQALFATISEKLHLGPLSGVLLKLSSLAVMWIAFGFIYVFMPNTRVRIVSALIGGVAGGTLWQLMQVLHVKFQVGMAKYNAIYSTFAAFPIFLFWVFLSWVAVLLGAHLAYAYQNEPAYRQIVRARDHDHAFKEAVAVHAMARMALRFLMGERPVQVPVLAEELALPERSVDEVLRKLAAAGLVAMAEDEHSIETFLPARDLERITVMEILDALKGREGPLDLQVDDPVDAEVDRVFGRYETECREAPHNLTLRALAEACRARRDSELARASADVAAEVAAESAG